LIVRNLFVVSLLVLGLIFSSALALSNPDSATLRGAAAQPQSQPQQSEERAPIVRATATAPWQFCTVGDITSEKVVNAVKGNTNCSAVVLLGDYYDKESKFVGGFKTPGVPLMAACGNHDDCDNVARNDNMAGGALNYGFRWKDTGFLILNTDESISSQKAKTELLMKRWQNNTGINHIVVAQHKAAITNPDAHHKESELKGYRSFFTEMQQKYPKFQVLLQGHNHNWMTCKPDSPKILVITDGTGGRKPYPLGSQFDDGCGKDTALTGSNHNGYTMVNLNGLSGKIIDYEHVDVGR